MTLKTTNAKRVLVTGGAGFLGSHLCEKLLALDCEVVCVDNLYSSPKQNINHLFSNPNFEFIRHDIIQPLHLEVDEIYNLACPASPIHYQRDPIQTIKTNVIGIANVLDLANRLKVPVLQASTSEVYGDPTVHPQEEGYWGNVNPIGPRACYDEGKRCAETLSSDYRRQFGVDTKIARIFNTYGPRMHPNDGRVVSNFIVQALADKPITIFGDGSQTRSFCFVSDLIEALVKIMDMKKTCGPINIGNPKEFTILQLANIVIKVCSSKSTVIHKERPVDDPMKRKPNIDLAREKLQWSPNIELEEGVSRTVKYFQDNQIIMES